MSGNKMTVEIEDKNDGKGKYQSFEKDYKVSISGENASFYGNLDLTIYGEDENEIENYNDSAINFIVNSLAKHTIKPKKRILIAIPTANNIESETFKSIYRLSVPKDYETHFECFYGYNVDQVRNLIADFAIKNNFDYVLCVDSDIVMPTYTLEALLLADRDVVTGVYRQRFLEKNVPEIYVHNEYGGTTNIDINELMSKQEIFEIAGCGFGGVLVKTEVFKKVGYPYFYYKDSIDFSETISEDTFFCLRAKEEGFNIYCIPGLTYGHVGKFTIHP